MKSRDITKCDLPALCLAFLDFNPSIKYPNSLVTE